MVERANFKRIVLGLDYNMPHHGMRLAVEVAGYLRLDLCGLFIEDENLFGLAAMPFAREFRSLGGGWQPIDVAQLSREMDIAARNAEKMFAEAVKKLQTTCRFDVVRGSIADSIRAISRSDDIVLLTEPRSPAEAATRQFQRLVETALGSAAAVMIVPARLARSAGAIVAIAAAANDPSIAAARAIAIAAKEDLIVIKAFKEPEGVDLVDKAAAIGITQLAASKQQLLDRAGIGSLFEPLNERLVVITRGMFEQSVPMLIESSRRVPVLVIEPSSLEGHQTRF